jgi:hypothetical protein
MDLLDDDMGSWLLNFYYTLPGLLRTEIEFSMIFLIGCKVTNVWHVPKAEPDGRAGEGVVCKVVL